MNSPKRPSWALIHSRAGPRASGAGPHSMVSKILATVVTSHHRMTVRGGVPAGDEMLELALDVGQERAGAQTEAVGAHPALAELLLQDRKSTRLNSSHPSISYAVFC